jgi:hypothetical protein
LNTTILKSTSDATTRLTCPLVNGRVAVCNYPFGVTGWLGLAQVWVDGSFHIYQGRALLNDSYSSSWTPAYRQFVMCQEVGHTFGLGHQDEVFSNPNLGSCMDYTSAPLFPPNNLALNQHDHDQLDAIYAHTDGYTTITQDSEVDAFGVDSSSFNDPVSWGTLVEASSDGRVQIYERDLDGGHRLVTRVLSAR